MEDEKDKLSLDLPLDKLEERLLTEKDPTELKNIIDVFNLNIKKKNLVRANKLSELQDKISNQIGERIDKNANAFSNKDLLDYFRAMQDTIEKSSLETEQIEIPTIQINQQININNDENVLSRDSKARVLEAVRAILGNAKQESTTETELSADTEIVEADYEVIADIDNDTIISNGENEG